MKNELIKTRVLQIFSVLLAVAGIVFCLQPLLSKDSNLWIRLSMGCQTIAMVYLAIYTFCGFRKKSAIFLKVFIILVMLSFFFSIVGIFSDSAHSTQVVSVIRQLISFAVLVALSVNENFKDIKFGRNKSMILCGIVLAEQVIGAFFILNFVLSVPQGGSMLGYMIAILACERVIIALSLFVAIYAKYEDVKKTKAAQIRSLII